MPVEQAVALGEVARGHQDLVVYLGQRGVRDGAHRGVAHAPVLRADLRHGLAVALLGEAEAGLTSGTPETS